MLIHQIFDNVIEAQGEKTCLLYGSTKITYQEFKEQIDDTAYRLGLQIQKGDRVLLKRMNPLDQLLYFFAVIKAGGICIFIDSSASPEVCDNLVHTHSISLIIDEKLELPSEKGVELPRISPTDIFLGALSSGSTGIPKLIWRDHQSWKQGFPVQSEVFNLSHEDTLYLVGSLVYTANLNACLHLLAEGGTVLLGSSSLPRTWLEEIRRQQVSALFMVPANYKVLLKVMKDPLLSIKSVVTAGAKMDLSTVQGLIHYFPKASICEYYGASELGHVSYSTAKDLLERPDSVGKAFPGVTITIEEDSIWVESSYLTPKCRPKGTVEDLGRMDEDGYLYLLGRKQGIINTGGVKVIPEQVEKILLECPGIKEAAVAGIDDEIRGQKVCAWIVAEHKLLLTSDIIEFCRRKLRPQYCPSKIIFIEQIPLNKNGKIDKMSLKNSLQGSSVEGTVL